MSLASADRTGVILAAGFGSRLAKGGKKTSLKPLTPVAGTPLIQRTLDSLEKAGCTRVVIVLGFQAEHIEQEIREAYTGPLYLEFAYNAEFEKSNGLSVLAARPMVDRDFILVMADHVLGDSLMDIARTHRPPAGGASLLVDRKIDSIFDMEDATKVRTDGDRIIAIGKKLDDFDCIDTGVFICTAGLFDALSKVVNERSDASLSEGVERLAQYGKMAAVDVGDGFWQDVDTVEMLAHAERVLLGRQDR